MKKKPWDFLEELRGTDFTGEWPTLPEMFRISARRFPDRPCLTVFEPDRVTLTYRETLERVETLAAWFAENGVAHGDHIAVSGKNSPEWAVAYLAVLFAGAVVIPIDYNLHDAEIENLLKASQPKFLCVDQEKRDHFLGVKAAGTVLSLSPVFPETYVYALAPRILPKDSPAGTARIVPAVETDLAAIMFTSGTMGVPKGVMLTHRNFVSDCYISQTNMELFPTDVFYALLPIHHAYTMLAVFIEALSVGAEVVFGKSMAVSRMLKELRDGKVTMLLGVPLLFNKLLAGIMKGVREKGPVVYGLIRGMMGFSYICKKAFGINPGKTLFGAVLEKAGLASIRIAISGGGPLASSVFRQFNELGIDFVQGYGLTETSPIVALNPKDRFKIESVGQYFRGYMEMKILEPNTDGVGEVAVRGPMVMKGYYNMPKETAEVLDAEGWFRTGDLGRLDSEGYLSLAGRAKNMIVTDGGKNVYPEEIENAFQLYYNEIEQIAVKGYLADKALKSEGIEALVYPADGLLQRLGLARGAPGVEDDVREEVEAIVDRVNKGLQPYQRISKVTVLAEPLEMTTKRTVKRNFAK